MDSCHHGRCSRHPPPIGNIILSSYHQRVIVEKNRFNNSTHTILSIIIPVTKSFLPCCRDATPLPQLHCSGVAQQLLLLLLLAAAWLPWSHKSWITLANPKPNAGLYCSWPLQSKHLQYPCPNMLVISSLSVSLPLPVSCISWRTYARKHAPMMRLYYRYYWLPTPCFAFWQKLSCSLISILLNSSMTGFNISLSQINVGVAYAAWSALGTLLVTSMGILLFKESFSPFKLLCLSLIVFGVIGLNLKGWNKEKMLNQTLSWGKTVRNT